MVILFWLVATATIVSYLFAERRHRHEAIVALVNKPGRFEAPMALRRDGVTPNAYLASLRR